MTSEEIERYIQMLETIDYLELCCDKVLNEIGYTYEIGGYFLENRYSLTCSPNDDYYEDEIAIKDISGDFSIDCDYLKDIATGHRYYKKDYSVDPNPH